MPNTKKILFVLLVIGMIIMMNQGKKQYIGDIWEPGDLATCNEWRNQDLDSDYQCVSDCVYADSAMANCISNTCDLEDIDVGYIYYSYPSMSCTSIRNEAKDVDCGFDCMLNPSCSCTTWTSQGCGSGGCNPSQLYQTRTCTPIGCDASSRCAEHSLCTCANGYIPDMALVPCSCGGALKSTGYCCNNVWQDIACGGIAYPSFLTYKSSYLSGGAFSTFISNANQWVT